MQILFKQCQTSRIESYFIQLKNGYCHPEQCAMNWRFLEANKMVEKIKNLLSESSNITGRSKGWIRVKLITWKKKMLELKLMEIITNQRLSCPLKCYVMRIRLWYNKESPVPPVPKLSFRSKKLVSPFIRSLKNLSPLGFRSLKNGSQKSWQINVKWGSSGCPQSIWGYDSLKITQISRERYKDFRVLPKIASKYPRIQNCFSLVIVDQ